MSRQSESEGSSDGTSEGDACEGGAGEELVGSVEGIRNLVSGDFVRLYVVVDGTSQGRVEGKMKSRTQI